MAEETIMNSHNITTATNLNQKAGSANTVNGHRACHANNEDGTSTK